jgi:hypothetical protein
MRFKVINNYRRLKRDEYTIKHGYEWRLLALANLPSIALLSIAAGALHQPIIKAGLIALSSGLMIMFFLWLGVDYWLNGLRGLTRFSLGSNDGRKDAFGDKILRPFPEVGRMVIKVLLLVGSIFFYYKMIG